MIRVTIEMHEGAVTRRVRISAPSIERPEMVGESVRRTGEVIPPQSVMVPSLKSVSL